MSRVNITQHVSAPLQAAGELPVAREAPAYVPERQGAARELSQWLLEDAGWTVLRPTVDFVLLYIAIVIAIGGVHATLHVAALRAPLLGVPPTVMLLLYLRGLYQTRLRALVLDGVVPVLSAVSVATMAMATAGVLINGDADAPGDLIRTWVLSLLAIGVGRIVLSFAQRFARSRGYVGKPVLIMGAGLIGSQVARRLESHPEYGLRPIGFLDDDPRSVTEVGGREMPVLGTVEDLDRIVWHSGVRHLIVAFSSVADARVSRLIQHCQELGIEVSVVPRMFDTINNRVGYDTVGGLPLMSFSMVDPKGAQFAIKHALDRIFAAAMLFVLSPLIIATAVAVRVSSPGPVLYRQRRVGRDGKVFDLYKFRSMRVEADPLPREDRRAGAEQRAGAVLPADDNIAFDFILGGDTAPGGVEGADRRTLVGRFLRRSSLDELPQLVNVLAGEMSIIGPRPERPEFVELFRQDIARYGDRHRVKSGITGWAQVHGLRGRTSLAERVEWDNYYIAHWSLGLDLRILLLTFASLFRNPE